MKWLIKLFVNYLMKLALTYLNGLGGIEAAAMEVYNS